MAWTSPMTAVANTGFTAAQYNRYIRDNLLETAPGKATAAGNHFATSGLNQIAERTCVSAEVLTSQTTTSTTYADLVTSGPSVTVECGTDALVWVNAALSNSGAFASIAGFEVSGSTTEAASDDYKIMNDGVTAGFSSRMSACRRLYFLNPGVHTFTMKYRVTGGTGTFSSREIIVLPL